MSAGGQNHDDYLVRITYRAPLGQDASVSDVCSFIVERVVSATSIGDAAAECAHDNRRFISLEARYVTASCEVIDE